MIAQHDIYVVVSCERAKMHATKKKERFIFSINPNTVTCDHGANIIIGREA